VTSHVTVTPVTSRVTRDTLLEDVTPSRRYGKHKRPSYSRVISQDHASSLLGYAAFLSDGHNRMVSRLDKIHTFTRGVKVVLQFLSNRLI
jgi:hypothetical protein